MIATLKTQNYAPKFESFLPALTQQFRRATRFIPLREDREEATQEMIALAFSYYQSLVDRDKTDSVFSTPLGDFAIRSFFAGRRVTGMSSTDITSPRCQKLDRAEVIRLEYRSKTDNKLKEINVYDKYHKPSTIAGFKIDFEAWIDTLDDKKKEILFTILEGYSTGELSKRFGVSPGRISQLRHELAASWKTFVADSPDKEED